jgi:hypothetical protein
MHAVTCLLRHQTHSVSVAEQQLTEAAVARERAKLYAEVKDRVKQQVAAGSEEELGLLRARHVHLPCLPWALFPNSHSSFLAFYIWLILE